MARLRCRGASPASPLLLILLLSLSVSPRAVVESKGAKDAERSRHYYCGSSWSDAASTCDRHCPSGASAECPDGLHCFADTPCDSEAQKSGKPVDDGEKREEEAKKEADPPPPPRATEEENSDRGEEPPPRERAAVEQKPVEQKPVEQKPAEQKPAEGVGGGGGADPAGGDHAGGRRPPGATEEGGGDDGSTAAAAAEDGAKEDPPPASAAATTTTEEEEDKIGERPRRVGGGGGSSLSPLGIVAQFASSLLGKTASDEAGGGPSTSGNEGSSDASAYLHRATDAARDLGSRVADAARAASSDPRVRSTGTKLRDVAVDVGKRTAGGVETAARQAAEAMKTTEAGRRFVETTARAAERAVSSSSRVGSAAVGLAAFEDGSDASVVAFATAGAFVILVFVATALRVCCRCRRSKRSKKRSDGRRSRDLSGSKGNDRLSYGRHFDDDDDAEDVDEEKADLAMLEEGYQVSKLERKNDAGERKEPFRLYTEFDYKLRKRSNAPQAANGGGDGGTGWEAQPYLHGNGHDWGSDDGGSMDRMNVRGRGEDRGKQTGFKKRSFFARILTFSKRLLLFCAAVVVLGCAYVVMTSEDMSLGTLFFVASTHLRHWTMGETAFERTVSSY